ncbi:MAG TPA: BamA/TamA family outer membrane protein [Gallionella sp.]
MPFVFAGASRLSKILLLLLSIPAAYAKTDPSFSWTTLSSQHFLVHYHQGEEELAKRAVGLAEDAHAKLVKHMRSEPNERTHIVLVDALDGTNGWSTTLPYNLITLYITPPLGEPGFGAHPYDDWMRMLIIHEYTHIMQMDMASGLPGVLQNIFGNLYFPNMWQPAWLKEGLAVYEETALTGGGRNRSASTEMMLRMAVLEDNFPPISHAANFTEQWPSGEVPYLFGGGFTSFIAGKYGREKLADVSLEYSGRAWPFLISSTANRTLGTDYPELWEEWQGELSARYRSQQRQVQQQGVSASRALTPNGANRGGYRNIAPAVSPDGRQIVYLVENAYEHPSIHLMKLDGSDDRELLENEVMSGSSIAWGPDGRGVYFTRTEMVRNTNLYNDVYYYDLEEDEEIRVTKNLRARDASPSPDNSTLVFVTNRLGKTRLATLSLPVKRAARERDVRWLTGESDNQYETPRYSPDGQRLVVAVRQSDGHKDIWILDRNGNKLAELMHDRAIDGGAVWSADGSRIYFASDRSGIFNLYAYDLASGKTAQVSNVVGGAFTPSVTPDGKVIAYANYSSQGYDIHAMDNRQADWKTAASYRDPYPAMRYDDQPVVTELGPYNPLPTLVPRLWLPNGGYSDYSGGLGGFFTFGSDAVERHSYVASVLYGPEKNRVWYDLNYQYDGLYPSLILRAQDMDVVHPKLLSQGTVVDPLDDYIERSRMFDAALAFPLFELDSQHLLTLGYRNTRVSGLSLPPLDYTGALPAEGKLVSGRVSYSYNNAERFGYSISPEDGRSIELGYEQVDKKFGSDFDLKKYTVDWHEYIDFPFDHHVLLVRAYGGRSTGDLLMQRAFQLGGDNPGDFTLNVEDTSVYLRGYPANQYRGQKVGLLSTEYRFPVMNLEYGFSNTPFFFKRVHGAVFAEAGNAWDGPYVRQDVKRSVGLEARLDMSLFYALPITVRAGLAQALDDKKKTSVIANIWLSLF